jgi:hypothetical protein
VNTKRTTPFVLAFSALGALALLVAPGCEKRMEPEECDKIRGEAFQMLNKAQLCATDADCKQSEWPGCEKPVNGKTSDALKPMQTSFTEGKCEEKKLECRKPPPVYCKQGLCVHREAGVDVDITAPTITP